MLIKYGDGQDSKILNLIKVDSINKEKIAKVFIVKDEKNKKTEQMVKSEK